jgi:hypothetical protein
MTKQEIATTVRALIVQSQQMEFHEVIDALDVLLDDLDSELSREDPTLLVNILK